MQQSLSWRPKALEKELRRLHTADKLIQFMKNAFDRLFERHIIPQHRDCSLVVNAQASIGWMHLLRGFWSTEWLDAHQSLVLASPVRDPTEQATRIKTNGLPMLLALSRAKRISFGSFETMSVMGPLRPSEKPDFELPWNAN
jgi:hypothetical protein